MMKPIDFTKYPKILPYVQDALNKPYFKPWEYNKMREDVYVEIVHEWIKKFEKHLDVLVNNTHLIYELTGDDTGYSSLEKDWEGWREYRIKNNKPHTKLDKDLIREWWIDKFRAIVCALYTSMKRDFQDHHYGVTGSLITVSFNVTWNDSDLKSVEKTAIVDMSLSLKIGTTLHSEIDQVVW